MYNFHRIIRLPSRTLCFLAALIIVELFHAGLTNTAQAAITYNFTFPTDLDSWSTWGDGTGRHMPGIGHERPGSVELRCNKGQEMTLYKKIDLPKGRYRVSAWLRALDVQPGPWNTSIWLFYKTDKGEVNAVKDLHGSFDWSRASYCIEVNDKGADIWFRLKSIGTLWVDDIRIEPYEGPIESFFFEKNTGPMPPSNPPGDGLRCPSCNRWMPKGKHFCTVCGEKLDDEQKATTQKREQSQEKMLMDFELGDSSRETRRYSFSAFSNQQATSGKRSAVLYFSKYNNINIVDHDMSDWTGYDYLAMDVYNPLEESVTFAVCIGDGAGGGYWNQLNHYTTLGNGWNRLRFHVNRYVGERGSVRNRRYLNLSAIKKFWFAVAPEDKHTHPEEFLVDNIRLQKAATLTNFAGLRLFDFVKDSLHTQPGFIGIETRHVYHPEVGFGFVNAKIWRAHDSLYADKLYRDGIFINKGSFRVDVPNGHYVVRFVVDALGEWYEHFWTRRTIRLQDRVVLDEHRRTPGDYLDDFLRFSEIEPTPQDNAYDLYLKKIFKEHVLEIEVKNGEITLDCDGDDSAIMLNSLIIYPVAQKAAGEAFMAQLERMQKEEFDTLCRRLVPDEKIESGSFQPQDRQRGFYTALIDVGLPMSYNRVYKSSGHEIKLHGCRLQRPVQALIVRNLGDEDRLTITASPLIGPTGQLAPRPNWVRYGVPQFQSHTLNHETYELAPRFLKNISENGIDAPKDQSLLFWYQVPLDVKLAPGVYHGTLDISLHEKSVRYPVTLEVEDRILPDADFAVGFFGLDPISYDYYNQAGVSEAKQEMRRNVLTLLHERGFTTWSSLPSAQFVRDQDSYRLEAPEVDALMEDARKLGFHHKIFTYGGKFPVVLDNYGTIDNLDQSEYRQKTAAALKWHMEKHNWLPVVFDISDEATGYSQTVERDTKRVEMLEKYFPFLRRGGYSHPIAKDQPGYRLNTMLTDISLSSVDDYYRRIFSGPERHWGFYTPSTQLAKDNRKTFGEELWTLRNSGCDHLLSWHLVLAQNYPYYDLDGRESDAMMLFPHKDGSLDFGINFELATLGLERYRLHFLITPKEH